MALDTTVAGPTANSYASIAEADALLVQRPGADAWAALPDATKEAALVTACRLMDRTLPWDRWKIGLTRVSLAQALLFPTTSWLTAAEDAYVTDGAVPPWVKEAQAEWAFQLTASDRLGDSAARGVASLSVGPLAITFDPATASAQYPTPDIVYQLLRPWLLSGAAAASPTGLVQAQVVLV